MIVRYLTANPCGNITVMVTSPAEQSEYAYISGCLLKAIPGAEQVGFLTSPLQGGDIRIEMMGGEFCGNALRCAAVYYLRQNKQTEEADIRVEISGCNRTLSVRVNPATNVAEGEIPLPFSIKEEGNGDTVYCFPGIAHIIKEDNLYQTAEDCKEFLKQKTLELNTPAAGLMQIDKNRVELTPVVYVTGTDTVYFENSCGSGTAAAALHLFREEQNGVFSKAFSEPGGVLTATVSKKQGIPQCVTIQGIIHFSEETSITL